MPSASQQLAIFAAALRDTPLPPPVVAKAKRHLLDCLGVALACVSTGFPQRVRAAVAPGAEAGTATLIGQAGTLPPPWAALVNGAAAHGLDFDDTHLGAVVHVSASVVPAALAAGEAAEADGAALLAGLAAGLEGAVRLGLAAGGAFHDRGFHPTGICGTFGAALAAGTIAGLVSDRLTHALGLCGSFAAGSLECLTDGSEAKRLHGGWAAHAGLTAVALAAAGVSGPRAIFEGRYGLYRSHLGTDVDPDAVTDGLGSRWNLLDIAVKPYPCCHYNHAFLDCAAALRPRLEDPLRDVEAIECHIAPREIPVVCEPPAAKRAPANGYDAKFSLPYAVACMLLRGRADLEDFTDEAARDPEVRALAERVGWVPDPTADFPRRFPGRLRIRLRSGAWLEHAVAVNRGGPEAPLSDAELFEKFRRNARRILGPGEVETLAERVLALERLPHIRELTAGLRPAAERRRWTSP